MVCNESEFLRHHFSTQFSNWTVKYERSAISQLAFEHDSLKNKLYSFVSCVLLCPNLNHVFTIVLVHLSIL